MPYNKFLSNKYTSAAQIFAFHCIDINWTGITKNIHSYEICFTKNPDETEHFLQILRDGYQQINPTIINLTSA